MKPVFFCLFFVVMFVFMTISSCQNNKAEGMMKDVKNFTTAAFPDSVQNFGTVERGRLVKLVFHVMNTGTKPLLIADAKPSCGCTVADFTKSAIAPGKQGEIVGTFDSNHGLPGDIRKSIAVTTNTLKTNTTLVFTGTVEAKSTTTKTN